MNQKALSAITIGFVLITSPVVLTRIPIDFVYPLTAKAILMSAGILLIFGGVFIPSAERYKLPIDLFIVISPVMFVLGPLSAFPLGTDFWVGLALAATIFIGLPSVSLLYLSSKDV